MSTGVGLAHSVNHEGAGNGKRPRSPDTVKGEPCLLPSHAAWFRTENVNDIERRALPEFFDGSSTSKTESRCCDRRPPRACALWTDRPLFSYKQARNFIVSAYREQPSLYLSFTECRRHIAIDVAAVMRLHQARRRRERTAHSSRRL